MNYFERVKKVFLNQKDGDIYYNYFTRYISAPITALLTYTWITPNMATYTMFFWGLSGAFFFSFGQSSFYIMGGLCYILLIVADTVDGELARYNGTSSLFGDYLDRLAHYVTNSAMISGIGIGLYVTYNEIIIFYISTFVLICYLFDDVSRDLLISCGLAESKSRKEEKEKLSIINKSNFRTFIAYTAKNTAFMHLIVLAPLIDILINKFYNNDINLVVTHSYILYFFIATIIKVLFRLPLIISLKNKY